MGVPPSQPHHHLLIAQRLPPNAIASGGVGVTMWIWRDTNIQVTIAHLKFSLLDRNVECLWVKGNYDRNGSFSDILPKLGGKAPDVLETELKLMGLHSS